MFTSAVFYGKALPRVNSKTRELRTTELTSLLPELPRANATVRAAN
jgi:hypothetical protein